MADLSLLEAETRAKAEALLAQAQAAGLSLTVVSTRRSCADQARLYAQGRTTPGTIVTNAKGCRSWHVLGRAFDVAFTGMSPTPSDWDTVGAIGEGLGLTWGKRFSGTLNDLPHFEWHPGMTTEQVCPNPDDCDGGVAQSLGERGATATAAWRGALVLLGAAAAGWWLAGRI